MADNKIAFTFKETEPDQSTFYARFIHFINVTDPRLFFVDD